VILGTQRVPWPHLFLCWDSSHHNFGATTGEVAMLRGRFEAEIARQAEKAAQLAAAHKLVASLPRSCSKRSDRTQQRARLTGSGGDKPPDSSDPSLTGTKPRGKKKKRSVLANASNPQLEKLVRVFVHISVTHISATNAQSATF
jgi:hypothetical protein